MTNRVPEKKSRWKSRNVVCIYTSDGGQ